MRDLIILTIIILYWICLGSFLTYIYQDPLIVSELVAGNSSYIVSVNTNDVAGNFSGTNVPLFENYTETETKGFLSMFGRMLTFRIPATESIPAGFLVIIESFNFLLVLLTGLILYRLIRHGGG